MKRWKRQRRNRGAAALESALILFLFLIMIIGVFDFGHFLYIHQALVERTRNAVRFGIVMNPYDATQIRNKVLYDQPTVPEGQPTGFLGLTSQMVTVQRNDAGTDDDRISVTVSGYPVPYFSPLMATVANGLPITTTLPYEVR